MNKKINARFQPGFTLMEILLVIAVMAVIAVMLFPVFAHARLDSQRKGGDKNIRKISLGFLQYIQDNDEKFPRGGYDCLDASTQPTAFSPGQGNQCGGDAWQNVVGPYVGDPSAFLAPGDKDSVGEGAWGGGMGNDLTPDDGNLSYLYNDLLAHRMLSKGGGYADPSTENLAADGLRITDIKTPSQCLLLSEGHGGWNKDGMGGQEHLATTGVVTDWTGSTDLYNKWHHEYDINGNLTPFMSTQSYNGTQFVRIGLPFNNNGGNVAYTDGHVKFVPYSTPAGLPLLCQTLPWAKNMDPIQRNANLDGCNDPDNFPGVTNGGWDIPNWF